MAKVLVVCGATASGKTSLAVALAKALQTEVISADALLVYQGLNIGTAKPTVEEMDGVVHHMVDVVAPTENFSVSDYEKGALPILEDLLARGKTPVICGGTGFYIQSLLYKSQFGNVGANEEVRQKYERLAEERGKDYVHSLLVEKDEESGKKLHPNDLKRVIRALEIYEVTGRAKSAQRDEYRPRYDFAAYSIDYPREVLYERIGLRVEQMFQNGLIEEVQSLLQNGVTPTMQCMQGIGYKEIAEGLEKGWSEAEMQELVKKNTRNYAKRQQTFFKRMENHTYLTPNENNVEKIITGMIR